MDAAGFDEFARRQRADAGDDAVALDPRLAVGGIDHEDSGLDGLGLGIDVVGDVSLVDRAHHQCRVGRFGVREIGHQIDDGDIVVG